MDDLRFDFFSSNIGAACPAAQDARGSIENSRDVKEFLDDPR